MKTRWQAHKEQDAQWFTITVACDRCGAVLYVYPLDDASHILEVERVCADHRCPQ